MTTKKKEDRRIRRTRKLLQNALIQLLKEKPLAKIQIKEIVDVADVSRPTFYQHFETKELLLFSHVEDLTNRIQEAIFAEAGDDTVNLLGLLTATYQQWQIHSEALQWVLQVENKDLLIGLLQSQLEDIKQEFDKHLPPLEVSRDYEEYVANFVAGGFYMLLKTWVSNGMRESPETMATLTSLLLYNGFSPLRDKLSPEDAFVKYATTQLQAAKHQMNTNASLRQAL